MKLLDPEHLSLNQYQDMAGRTAVYPGQGTFLGLMYVTGKLNGEAGEVAENVFKALRDDKLIEHLTMENGFHETYRHDEFATWEYNGETTVTASFHSIDEERRQKIKKELGDVLWYVARAAKEIGYSLGDIAVGNIQKLASRQDRGELHGSGDDR